MPMSMSYNDSIIESRFHAKKPTVAVGEGMFKVTLVFVSAMMSSKETADAVSACIDNVCEHVEVLELLREACS